MPAEVFADTVGWIAMLDATDSLHATAWQVATALRRRKIGFVTTEFVLLEVADALCDPAWRVQTVAFLVRPELRIMTSECASRNQ